MGPFLRIALALELLAASLLGCSPDVPAGQRAVVPPGVPPRPAPSAIAPTATAAPSASLVPGPIVALTTRCALLRDGHVRCWEPAAGVAELTDAVALAGDAEQQWAIDRAGVAHCSGCSAEALAAVRALGPLTAIAARGAVLVRTVVGAVFAVEGEQAKPVPVPLLPVELEVAAGSHRCARYASGELYCWGHNGEGQLGHRPPIGEPQELGPSRVEYLSDAIAVSGGLRHSCAVHRSGHVTCWGGSVDEQGALGGLHDDLYAPVEVPHIDDAVEIDGVHYASCVVRRSGRVSCWGRSEAFPFFTLGGGPFELDVADAEHVALSEKMACVALRSGEVRCFGDRDAKVPRPPVGFGRATAVAVGDTRSCALVAEGELWCWGSWEHLLGYGTTAAETANVRKPRPVHDVHDAVALAMSRSPSRVYDGCVARRSGAVTCWHGPDRTDPNVSDAHNVCVGQFYACALRTGGKVSCWGHNDDHQLGREGAYSSRATEVAGLEGAVALGCAADATCVLDDKGALLCWGSNGSGLLGDGRKTIRSTARPKSGLLSDGIELAMGFHHACALKRDHRVACWGFNGWREVNFTSVTDQPKPVIYPGVKDVAHVRLGSMRTCVLRQPGALSCWGSLQADLDSVFPDKSREVAMPGVVDVSIGEKHACALTATGEVLCWGDDAEGELGRGAKLGTWPVLGPLVAAPPAVPRG